MLLPGQCIAFLYNFRNRMMWMNRTSQRAAIFPPRKKTQVRQWKMIIKFEQMKYSVYIILVSSIMIFLCLHSLTGVKSNHMVLRNPDCAITYHVSTQRQNIIDRNHTWQQCSITMWGDILTTKYGFNLRQICIDNKLHNNKRTLWVQNSVPRMC